MKLLRLGTVILTLASTPNANAHDIYVGVVSKDGRLCCGANDCFATTYTEKRGQFFLRLKPEDGAIELNIPEDIITWASVVGDTADGPPNKAHLCYRRAEYNDLTDLDSAKLVLDGRWRIFCVFIQPGGT